MKYLGLFVWGLVYIPAFILLLVLAIPGVILDLFSGDDPVRSYRYKSFL